MAEFTREEIEVIDSSLDAHDSEGWYCLPDWIVEKYPHATIEGALDEKGFKSILSSIRSKIGLEE